jgi:hypothetical protein
MQESQVIGCFALLAVAPVDHADPRLAEGTGAPDIVKRASLSSLHRLDCYRTSLVDLYRTSAFELTNGRETGVDVGNLIY